MVYEMGCKLHTRQRLRLHTEHLQRPESCAKVRNPDLTIHSQIVLKTLKARCCDTITLGEKMSLRYRHRVKVHAHQYSS